MLSHNPHVVVKFKSMQIKWYLDFCPSVTAGPSKYSLAVWLVASISDRQIQKTSIIAESCVGQHETISHTL